MWKKRHVISVITHGYLLMILRHTHQRNVFYRGAKTKELPCYTNTYTYTKYLSTDTAN